MLTNNSFFTPENLTLKSQPTKWKYRSNIKLFPLTVNFEPLCRQVSTTCRSFHVSQIKPTDGHVNKPPDSVPCPVLIYCYLDNAQLCFDKWKVVLASAQTHAIKMHHYWQSQSLKHAFVQSIHANGKIHCSILLPASLST